MARCIQEVVVKEKGQSPLERLALDVAPGTRPKAQCRGLYRPADLGGQERSEVPGGPFGFEGGDLRRPLLDGSADGDHAGVVFIQVHHGYCSGGGAVEKDVGIARQMNLFAVGAGVETFRGLIEVAYLHKHRMAGGMDMDGGGHFHFLRS
jgi:hypothetical protein